MGSTWITWKRASPRYPATGQPTWAPPVTKGARRPPRRYPVACGRLILRCRKRDGILSEMGEAGWQVAPAVSVADPVSPSDRHPAAHGPTGP